MNALERLAKYWGIDPEDVFDRARDTGLISDNCETIRDVWAEDAERAARTIYKAGR